MKMSIKLVELVADEGKYLTDINRSGTFKKISVKEDDVDNYIEISAEEAEAIELALATEGDEQEVENVDTVVDSTDSEN